MSKSQQIRVEKLEQTGHDAPILICGATQAEAEAAIEARIASGAIAAADRARCVAIVTGVPRATQWVE